HEEAISSLPEGCGWLLAEFGGDTQEEAVNQAEELIAAQKRDHAVADAKLIRDKTEQTRIWAVRKAGLGATAYVPGKADTWEGWEDSAVAPDKVGNYLRDLDKLTERYGYE